MKAFILRQTGEPKSVLEMAEVPTPPLGPGEALVRVLRTPIKASDLLNLALRSPFSQAGKRT